MAPAGGAAGVSFESRVSRKEGAEIRPMSVTDETLGRVGFVSLEGELDLASSPSVEREIRDRERHSEILILDLRHVGFIDSTGLRVITSADARARAAGRRLVLVRGSDPVQRVFRITRLDRQLEFVDEPSDL
ncbi:MAG TPA: STAS domain-containing protein [Actinomycetota bacterium]|nr:STAS domain-containing protein [Actinomycetota bacterium]